LDLGADGHDRLLSRGKPGKSRLPCGVGCREPRKSIIGKPGIEIALVRRRRPGEGRNLEDEGLQPHYDGRVRFHYRPDNRPDRKVNERLSRALDRGRRVPDYLSEGLGIKRQNQFSIQKFRNLRI
jgi:hypothetical protein